MIRFPALVLVPVFALGLTAAHAASLPDTGQDLCDDGSNVLVACTSANTGDSAAYPRQDGRFGRDAKARDGTLTKIGGGAAGFDYSKIANNGSDLGAGTGLALGTNPGDWACTRDNITGLVWEVKVNDNQHLRHMGWIYGWYNSDGSTNGGNAGLASTTSYPQYSPWCKTDMRCDTEKFAADVNAAALCGYTDWRMPTRRELLTLVHAGTSNPSIDVTYFPNTQAKFFHSSTVFAGQSQYAGSVAFDVGGSWWGPKDRYAANVSYVRLVRGAQF